LESRHPWMPPSPNRASIRRSRGFPCRPLLSSVSSVSGQLHPQHRPSGSVAARHERKDIAKSAGIDQPLATDLFYVCQKWRLPLGAHLPSRHRPECRLLPWPPCHIARRTSEQRPLNLRRPVPCLPRLTRYAARLPPISIDIFRPSFPPPWGTLGESPPRKHPSPI
jgi:hypothetical protein